MQQSSINSDGTVTITGPLTVTAGISTATTGADMYSYSSPEELSRWFSDEGVEIIYKQLKTPLFTYTCNWNYSQPSPETIVYKEVHTFGPGGHTVTRVEGKYIPPQDESYEFED